MAVRLTYGRRTGVRVRDMMIDRVAPLPGCGRSFSLDRPWSPTMLSVVARSDSEPMELAAVVPVIAEAGLPVLVSGFSQCQRAMVVGAVGWAMMVKASSPRPVRMWVACRTMRRAWDRQARFAS